MILRSHSVKLAKSFGKFFRISESLNLIAVIFVFSISYSTDSIVNLTWYSFAAVSDMFFISIYYLPL